MDKRHHKGLTYDVENFYVSLIPSLKTNIAVAILKSMVGSDDFFGARPIFRGALLELGRWGSRLQAVMPHTRLPQLSLVKELVKEDRKDEDFKMDH